MPAPKSADGELVDVYIGEHPESRNVWVVDQLDADSGDFDEHKVMLAFKSKDEAEETYVAGFSDGKGKERMGAVTEMTVDEFKEWLSDGSTDEPLGEASDDVDAEHYLQQVEIPEVLLSQMGFERINDVRWYKKEAEGQSGVHVQKHPDGTWEISSWLGGHRVDKHFRAHELDKGLGWASHQYTRWFRGEALDPEDPESLEQYAADTVDRPFAYVQDQEQGWKWLITYMGKPVDWMGNVQSAHFMANALNELWQTDKSWQPGGLESASNWYSRVKYGERPYLGQRYEALDFDPDAYIDSTLDPEVALKELKFRREEATGGVVYWLKRLDRHTFASVIAVRPELTVDFRIVKFRRNPTLNDLLHCRGTIVFYKFRTPVQTVREKLAEYGRQHEALDPEADDELERYAQETVEPERVLAPLGYQHNETAELWSKVIKRPDRPDALIVVQGDSVACNDLEPYFMVDVDRAGTGEHATQWINISRSYGKPLSQLDAILRDTERLVLSGKWSTLDVPRGGDEPIRHQDRVRQQESEDFDVEGYVDSMATESPDIFRQYGYRYEKNSAGSLCWFKYVPLREPLKTADGRPAYDRLYFNPTSCGMHYGVVDRTRGQWASLGPVISLKPALMADMDGHFDSSKLNFSVSVRRMLVRVERLIRTIQTMRQSTNSAVIFEQWLFERMEDIKNEVNDMAAKPITANESAVKMVEAKLKESDELDLERYVDTTLDVVEILTRNGFHIENNGGAYRIVYRNIQPSLKSDLMIYVTRRGAGMETPGQACYDIVLYNSKGKEWVPFKYIWGRTVMDLDKGIKLVIKAITDDRMDLLGESAGPEALAQPPLRVQCRFEAFINQSIVNAERMKLREAEADDFDYEEYVRNLPEVKSVLIHGRRWFRRSAGNTYFSADIYVNDKRVHRIDYAHGYGDHYIDMAAQWLDRHGYIKLKHHENGSIEQLWQYCKDRGIKYDYSVEDVKRRQDL